MSTYEKKSLLLIMILVSFCACKRRVAPESAPAAAVSASAAADNASIAAVAAPAAAVAAPDDGAAAPAAAVSAPDDGGGAGSAAAAASASRASRLSEALSKVNFLETDARIASNLERYLGGPVFFSRLEEILGGDPHLYELVDKKHPFLQAAYAPPDLIPLHGGKSYAVSRSDLSLRRAAEASLEEMSSAAKTDGAVLLVSSTYRSYSYQTTVYKRNVDQMGQDAADRESAKPGYSQHQTGLVADFGSISDDYALTRDGRWLTANAPAYGWIISFPEGYEAVTGYRWECWHYRYMGRPLAAFITDYFDGVQQYALEFIYYWNN